MSKKIKILLSVIFSLALITTAYSARNYFVDSAGVITSTGMNTSGNEFKIISDGKITAITGMSGVTGNYNFDSASVEIPNSTSLPSTCTIGEQYMDTDATSGSRFFLCESANTWASQGGSVAVIQTKPNIGDVADSSNQLMQNILLLLPFVDGVGTTVTDFSGLGNNVTMSGGFTWTNDLGGSILFDGTAFGDAGNISSTVFAADYTMVAQLYDTGDATSGFIIAKEPISSDGFASHLATSETAYETRFNGTGGGVSDANSQNIMSDDRLVITRNGSTTIFYVNGVNVGTYSESVDGASTGSLLLGSVGWTTLIRYQGRMSDVRIYDRGFNASDVALDFSDPWGMFSNVALKNIIEDTTPELGGTLIVNNFGFATTTGVNFAIGSSTGNDFTVGTNKLVVAGDTGSVGIGTPPSTWRFLIKGIGTLSQNLVIVEGSDTTAKLTMETDGSGNAFMNLFDTSSSTIQLHSSGLSYLSGGNTGFGVNDPDEQVEINGRLHLGQTTAPGTTTDKLYNVAGALTWNGTDISGGGGGGGHVIEDETIALTARSALNFTGNGVVCTDNVGTDATDCTVSGLVGSGEQSVGVSTSSTSVPSSGIVVLTFEAAQFDTNNMHDLIINPSRLTVKVAGKYYIWASVNWTPQKAGYRILDTELNGVDIASVTSAFNSNGVNNSYSQDGMSSGIIADLSVNDYIEFSAKQDSGLSVSVLSTSRFGMSLIEAGAGIANIVDDVTPQLGGNLDGQAFDITTTGQVKSKEPAVRVSLAGNQTITTATYTVLNWALEDFDTDTMHDTSTNTSRLIATTAGIYHIIGTTTWVETTSSSKNLRFRRNGSIALTEVVIGGVANESLHLSQIIELNATDYVELLVRHQAGSDQNVSNVNSDFAMFKISDLP